MSKCIVVADVDPAIATTVAHLLASAFDAPIVKQRLKQDFGVIVSGELCFENVLAAEAVAFQYRSKRCTMMFRTKMWLLLSRRAGCWRMISE